jgi:putative transposase
VPENIILLRQAFREVMTEHPFKIDAAVILPDHLHCVCYHPDATAPRRRFLYPLAVDQKSFYPSL